MRLTGIESWKPTPNPMVLSQPTPTRFSSVALLAPPAFRKAEVPSAEVVQKATDDMAAYIRHLKMTMDRLTTQHVAIQQTKGKHGTTVAQRTRSVFRPSGLDRNTFNDARRAYEDSLRPSGLSFEDKDRLVKRQYIGLWAFEKHTDRTGSQRMLMPSHDSDPKEYSIESYQPSIHIEQKGWQSPKVTYHFPHPRPDSPRLPDVEITDRDQRTAISGLAQRLDDKISGINWAQRLHRLATYGYWTP